MLYNLELSLPTFSKYVILVVGNPLQLYQYFIDCDLKNDQLEPVYSRLLWLIPLVLIILIIGIGFYLLTKLFNNRLQVNFYKNSFCFVYFIYFVPSIMNTLTGIISCRIIDNVRYVVQDLTVECYTQNHFLWIFIVVYPSIFGLILLTIIIFLKISS